MNFTFHSPYWLLALVALPVVAWLRGRRPAPALVVPFAAQWHLPGAFRRAHWPEWFLYLALALLAVALARPQEVKERVRARQEGYDLMLAIDLSGSMLAEDFREGLSPINRLQAVKPVIQAFIDQRPDDRIGIVVFAGRAYTLSPLTFDHAWLRRQLGRLSIGMLEDGTAIGDGLATALTRLEQAGRTGGGRRKGAFVVLLTDGNNNRGAMQPLDAAAIAQSRGIPVYTIGAGSDGPVRMPVKDEAGRTVGYRTGRSDLDEPTLRKMADLTGGRYYRATDSGTVVSAFREIDRTQKIDFQARAEVIAEEKFPWALAPALLLLAAAWAGRRTMAHAEAPA